MTKKNNRSDLEHEVRMKAYKDPEFRKNLLAHPKETLKKVSQNLGMDSKILDHYNHVHIIEEKPGELHVSIPVPSKTDKPGNGGSLNDACTTSCPTDYTGFCPIATA